MMETTPDEIDKARKNSDPTAPPHPGVHMPPPLLFVFALGAGRMLHGWKPLSIAGQMESPFAAVIGWCLIVLGSVIYVWAIRTFARDGNPTMPNRPVKILSTDGPYRMSRNPRYTSLFAVYLGVSLLINALWPVLLFPAVWAGFQYWIIPREERYLTEAFGSQFSEYCARVRRWI